MNQSHALGMRGEFLCSAFLKSKGWKILERNVNSPFGEVDIICERQGCLWAVEVKTRHRIDQIWIPGIVSRCQRQRIRNAFEWYVGRHSKFKGHSLGMYLAIIDMEAEKIQMFQLFPTI